MQRKYHAGRVLKSAALFLFLLFTFSSAHAQRELDVKVHCGAIGDGVTDDTHAIQLCLAKSKRVRFTEGHYYTSKPLYVNRALQKLFFDDGAYLEAHFAGGAALLLASPRQSLSTTGAIVTGEGRALRGGVAGNYLYASDAMWSMDGLTALTVEAYISISDTFTSSPNVLVSMEGRRSNSEGMKRAFWLGLGYNSCMEAFITDSAGVSHRLAAGRVEPGTHHLALQLSNGVAVIFLDGMPLASDQVDAIQQTAEQELMIGAGAGIWPMAGAFFEMPEVDALDSVRVSSSAKYSPSGFTPPTAKLLKDTSTLLLINDFSTVDNNFVKAETNRGDAYLTLPHLNPDGLSPQIGGLLVDNAAIYCHNGASGIYGLDTIFSTYSNISVMGGKRAFHFRDNLNGRLLNLGAHPSYDWGLLVESSEALTIDRINMLGGRYPVIFAGAVGGDFRNFYLTPTSETIALGLLKGGDMTLTSYQGDDESTASQNMEADFILADFTTFTLIGGQSILSTPRPFMKIDGSGIGRVAVINPAIFGNSKGSPLFQITNPKPNLVWGFVNNVAGRELTNEPSAVNVIQ